MASVWDKTQTIPFVDIHTTGDEPEWARIGKSTIFNLSLNAQTETLEFIEDEVPTDAIKYYKPELPLELYTMEGDKAFDAMFELFEQLPTGKEAEKDMLLVFPKKDKTASTSFRAWKVSTMLIFTNFDTVAKKLYFNLNFKGNIQRGTVAITSGSPTFTEDAKNA